MAPSTLVRGRLEAPTWATNPLRRLRLVEVVLGLLLSPDLVFRRQEEDPLGKDRESFDLLPLPLYPQASTEGITFPRLTTEGTRALPI